MQYLVKIFIFLSLVLSAVHVHTQVTSVQYAILLNSNTNLFDCFISVEKGQASTVRDRVQFNAQYSLIIPTGADVKIESCYMPLINNQNYSGDQPIKWDITSRLTSPAVTPGFDYYGITPTLAPAGFYNELERGDLVKLFSLKIEGEDIDFDKVRIFDNELDPKSHETGMLNGDFSNGFTMGGYHQLYDGIKIINQEEANYTSLEHEK